MDGGATAVGSPNRFMYVRLPSMDTNCWFGSADVITDTSPLPTPDGDISSAGRTENNGNKNAINQPSERSLNGTSVHIRMRLRVNSAGLSPGPWMADTMMSNTSPLLGTCTWMGRRWPPMCGLNSGSSNTIPGRE